MGWPNPIKRRNDNICTVWGYSFLVTPQHLTKEDTAAMKMSYDRLGEAALERLNEMCPPKKQIQHNVFASEESTSKVNSSSAKPQPLKRDLFVLLRDHAAQDETLGRLWTSVNTVPHWVCWKQLERGQEVFYRYGGPALTGLAFQSLLGGMVQCRLLSQYAFLADSVLGRSQGSRNAFSDWYGTTVYS
ncbi:MAG: hypothetical protein LQ338_007454 [Usnochroma carphineum]|nr:MAG: hypothetical protein LQ338_007454 [Usnochroma carphineum]